MSTLVRLSAGLFCLITVSASAAVHTDEQVAESKKAIFVTRVEMPSAPGARDLICLGDNWEKVDIGAAMRVMQFKARNENAFQKIEGTNELSSCFAPSLLPDDEREKLSRLLKHLESITGQTIAAITPQTEQLDLGDDSPQRHGLLPGISNRWLRAEVFIGGAEVLGMGALLVLPKTISQWEKDPLKSWKFQRAWTNPPVWDPDKWYVNYVGHPVVGALYYNAVRSQGAGMLESFLFSTLQSVTWEYLIEAWAEQPSAQDLLFTSTTGAVLGEIAHRATLRMRRNGFNMGEKIIVTIINPMYVIMNGYN